MLKTIKTTKQLRLDELIKYVRENKENLFKEYVSTEFKTENNKEIIFIDNGNFVTADRINIDDLFPLEVEEEITEDTIFERCVVLLESGAIYTPVRCNIKYIEEYYVRPIQVLVRINGKLELIWECDNQ